jgi:hypothetical protein
MDLITDLPPVDGCDSILVVVDRGNTKGAILIPTAKTLTQEGAVIGMKNDIPWIIKFFIYYISNQNPILLTTGAVRIKSADYTC